MGFFSWNTQDTGRSIANTYSGQPTFRVHMLDDKGNVWTEDNYEGYGEFGGKDFYELLSEMNGGPSDRGHGIELAFRNNPQGYNPDFKQPNLVEELAGWTWINEAPESCPDQGYFYPSDEDEEEENEWNEENEEDEL